MPWCVWARGWMWVWVCAVAAAITAPEGEAAGRCPVGSSLDAQERAVPYLQKDLPPPELLPPPLNDVPALLFATDTTLMFELTVTKKSWSCPSKVIWAFKAEQSPPSTPVESYRNNKNTKCEFNQLFENLKPNTVYSFQPTPKTENRENWYTRGYTPYPSNAYTVFARTCSNAVSPVKDLKIHSAGAKWLGLSWEPPDFHCVTNLEYYVKYSSEDFYLPMGSFASNNVHNVQGSALSGLASPCVAWPQRHCLLLAVDLESQKEFSATVLVRRAADGRESAQLSVKLPVSEIRNIAPGAPVGLRVVAATASAVELRWGCPLTLGGRLGAFEVRAISDARHAHDKHHFVNTTLCPEYAYTLRDLKEDTQYSVYVWFITTASRRGKSASLPVQTLPGSSTKTASPSPTTTSTSSSTSAPTIETSTLQGGTCVTSHPQQLVVQREGENQWLWIAGCSALLVMVLVAFFAGRRSAAPRQWKSSRLEETHSCDGIDKKGGDKAWLCTGAGPGARPGTGTPPASALPEYAEAGPGPEAEVEVDLSTGRAWTAVAVPGARRSLADHYEELGADKYAQIGEPGEAPNHLYAEVHKPPPPPPPAVKTKPKPKPSPSSAGVGVPVYAEVDLEKKHAQRAKR